MQTLQKTPEKFKTIADLQINWNFNQIKYHYFADFYFDFQNKNPNFLCYNIIPNTYKFKRKSYFPYGDDSEFSFWIKINKGDTLIKLMYFIHNEVANFLKRDNIQNLTLGKFVKITDNSFEVVEEIPF